MSRRLPTGGIFVDRQQPVRLTFNGKRYDGYEGDTLASALLAGDQMLMGRSFKYHRPRGVVASGAEEPNALVNLGRGARAEPNQRATTTEVFDGLTATSQNHWPSLEFDVGAINRLLARFLPAGFYYKMFIHPRPLWKHLYEPFIRQSAGLGQPPKRADADTYEHVHVHTDVMVVGGGVAGLLAARRAGEAGLRVLLVEQTPHFGGRALIDGGEVAGQPVATWVLGTIERLARMPNVTMRVRCMGAGVLDHGHALAYERLTDHRPDAGGPRHRLWQVRARQIITATGAIERPLAFARNDLPGVMLASAVRDYAAGYGVAAGDKTLVVTNNDDAYRTALTLRDMGLGVSAILDARSEGGGALMAEAEARGIRVVRGRGIARVVGGRRVTAVDTCAQDGDGTVIETIPCDAVAMSGGWSPAVHLWSHCGGKLVWDEAALMFRPDLSRPPTGADGAAFVTPAGSAMGAMGLDEVLGDAWDRTGEVMARLGGVPTGDAPPAPPSPEAAIAPVWMMPAEAPRHRREKAWLDFQNDVKVSDVQLAAQEGFESVEHAKRYTTLGMATDQGKLSNINGLAILSKALGAEIPEVGTTTFRPPYTPISLGSIAGVAARDLFQPLRKTPLHDWHEEAGADFEPVGLWRRPYAFPQGRESDSVAVAREVLNTRNAVGLLDASTLGKLVVRGPDAGRFLDLIYTGRISTLPEGRCKYGLMCSDNGFLIDDGVVARTGPDAWLCHTTTGGADRILGHMEEWLQTEWWDMKVYVANVTEQYGQIAVVGPKARQVLEALGGMDVSNEALPFMHWVDGTLAGLPVRIYRISFSGELSFEIAVRAGDTRALWDRLLEAGAAHGIQPYGTEALHIMRAEKGFIMIGDETDGTVIPQDLNLGWAIAKKKDDYLGKRAQARPEMVRPDRWRLVGLQTLDGSVLPDGAYALGEGVNANGQQETIGRVTSTYHSPTLGRGIAMGLVAHGPDRMGEVLTFPRVDGTEVRARIVDPVVYDKEGAKQNV